MHFILNNIKYLLEYFDWSNQPICSNLVDCFFTAIKNNPTVKYINLSNTHISQCVPTLCKLLYCGDLKLSSLNLSSNNFTLENTKEILKALMDAPYNLLEFDYSNNHLGTEGAKLFQEYLSKNNELTFLSLNSTGIGDEGLSYILEGIKESGYSVSYLLLRSCNITINAKDNFSTFLSNSKLKRLDISWNKMEGNVGEFFLKSHIEQLILGSLELGTTVIPVIETLLNVKSLTTLSLSSQHALVENGDVLYKLFTEMPNLQKFDFHSNDLTKNSIECIAKGIRETKTLQVLSLGNTGLNMDLLPILTESLKVNKTIVDLILFLNMFEDEGAKHLADVLKVNDTLRSLVIWECGISTQGFKYLADVLLENKTLVYLDIRDNEGDIEIWNDYLKMYHERGITERTIKLV